jgi:hypothetical protein
VKRRNSISALRSRAVQARENPKWKPDPYFSKYLDAGRLPIHIVVSDENITLEGVVDPCLYTAIKLREKDE